MDIIQLEKKYCSQGDTSGKHNPKKFFKKATGCFLFDEDNVPFLDMQMHNSACNFGYGQKDFLNTMNNTINTLPNLAGEFMNEERVKLSFEICKYMEENYHIKGRVHFNVGGAQAVDDALKLSINFNHKKKFFAFEGGYHGRTMAASSVSSSIRYSQAFGSVLDTYRIPFPNCFRCPYGREPNSCNYQCIESFQRLFKSEYFGICESTLQESAYSGFIFEPILGRGGYLSPPPFYLPKLLKILKEHKILLICDEVQMGIYRTGKMWAFENYKIVPDIIIFGKSFTNGLWPLSGVWAKEDILCPNIWPVGSCHSTFAGHPLGTALGLTALNITKRQDFILLMNNNAKVLHTTIKNIQHDYPCIANLSMIGHAIGFEIIYPNNQTPNPKLAKKLIDFALYLLPKYNSEGMGLILSLGGIYENSIMLSPCLYISEEEIQLFEYLFRICLEKSIHL